MKAATKATTHGEGALYTAFCEHFGYDCQEWTTPVRRQFRKAVAHCRKCLRVAAKGGAA